MKKFVYLDFDGTLICCANRLYGLFSSMIAPQNIEEAFYWKLRSSGFKQKDILRKELGYTDEACTQFAEKWLEQIESEYWLQHDSPREHAQEVLAVLSDEYDLILATNRQNRDNLLQEVTRMGFAPYFAQILVTEQKTSKEDMIRALYNGQGVIVGDTCEDIRTACALGLPSVIIRSEFEGWKQILAHEPSAAILSLEQLPQALRELF